MEPFDWSSVSSFPSPSPTGSKRPPGSSPADRSWPWEGSFPCLDHLRTLVRAGGPRVDLEAPPGGGGRAETFAGRIRGPQISPH